MSWLFYRNGDSLFVMQSTHSPNNALAKRQFVSLWSDNIHAHAHTDLWLFHFLSTPIPYTSIYPKVCYTSRSSWMGLYQMNGFFFIKKKLLASQKMLAIRGFRILAHRYYRTSDKLWLKNGASFCVYRKRLHIMSDPECLFVGINWREI